MSFFKRFRKKETVATEAESFNKELNDGLSKTRKGFVDKLFGIFQNRALDDAFYEDLEEALIQGDVGVTTALDLVDDLRQEAKTQKVRTTEDLQEVFATMMADLLGDGEGLTLTDGKLNVVLVVGVNGVGKTTSIGKIAHRLDQDGKKVILAAADTFRAAAADQLKIWGERVGCDVIAHQEGADPAAVVFDAMKAAEARKADVLLVDTAGRLHNKVNLMNELGKIKRIIDRENPEALKEVLLVLDATTGQNALSQAKAFQEVTDVTGVVLTKLDGTAKGGIVIGIHAEYHLPVKFIGVGEGIDHLQVFDPQAFAQALFADLGQGEEGEAEEALDDDAPGEESHDQDLD